MSKFGLVFSVSKVKEDKKEKKNDNLIPIPEDPELEDAMLALE